MLAMAEEGYDTCPLGGYDSHRIKKLLHLPYGAEVSMVVTCGIREERGIWGEGLDCHLRKCIEIINSYNESNWYYIFGFSIFRRFILLSDSAI